MNWIKSVLGLGRRTEETDPYQKHTTFSTVGELYIPYRCAEKRACMFAECKLEFKIDRTSTHHHSLIITNLMYDSEQENLNAITIPLDSTLEFSKFKTTDMDKTLIPGLSFISTEFHYLFFFLVDPEKSVNMLQLLICQLLYETRNPGVSWWNVPEKEITALCDTEEYEILILKGYEKKMSRAKLRNVLWEMQGPLYCYDETKNSILLIEDNAYVTIEEEASSKYTIITSTSDNTIRSELIRPDQVQFLEGKKKLIWMTIESSTVYAVSVNSMDEQKTLCEAIAYINDELSFRNLRVTKKYKYNVDSANTLIRLKGDLYKMDSENNMNVLMASDAELFIIEVQEGTTYAIVVVMVNGDRIETEITNFQSVSIVNKEDFFIWLSEDGKDAFTFSFPSDTRIELVKTLSFCKQQATQEEETKEYDEHSDSSADFDEYAASYVIGEDKLCLTGNFTDSLQGYHNDRTFVIMGSHIIVYKASPDYENALEYVSTLPIVSTFHQSPAPQKAILHEGEKSLLCVTEDGSQITKTDLETGKVVESFSLGQNNFLEDIANYNKNAQITPEATFVGITDSAIFRIDPRIPGTHKIAYAKQYKTNKLFSCIKATLTSGLALGSYNGEIRLYKSAESKKAAALFPGFGDPVLGIDVTLDGKWVLATCEKYLVLVPTLGLGAEKVSKRDPIKLTLSEGDWKRYGLSREKFTYATFNNGNYEGVEEGIVTSIGQYIVMWSLTKVKRGKLFDYKIKQLVDRVVLNQFKFNHPENVLVTLPQTVKLEKRIHKKRGTDCE